MERTFEFDATITAGARGGAFVEVPAEVIDGLQATGRVPVVASFDGESYRGSLVRMRGLWVLGIRTSIRTAIAKDVGSVVRVTLSRDVAPRTVEVPLALADALARKPDLLEAFERLSYTHRKEYATWILEAKKDETRARRIRRALEMIERGMSP
jgi:hypothetical protein